MEDFGVRHLPKYTYLIKELSVFSIIWLKRFNQREILRNLCFFHGIQSILEGLNTLIELIVHRNSAFICCLNTCSLPELLKENNERKKRLEPQTGSSKQFINSLMQSLGLVNNRTNQTFNGCLFVMMLHDAIVVAVLTIDLAERWTTFLNAFEEYVLVTAAILHI